MATYVELKMNTRVRRGWELVLDDDYDVNPIIDLDNIRYLVDLITFQEYGALIWTRYDISTQLPLDGVSYTRRYAAHNMFADLLLGQTGTINELRIQQTDFPSFPVPDDNGTVTP